MSCVKWSPVDALNRAKACWAVIKASSAFCAHHRHLENSWSLVLPPLMNTESSDWEQNLRVPVHGVEWLSPGCHTPRRRCLVGITWMVFNSEEQLRWRILIWETNLWWKCKVWLWLHGGHRKAHQGRSRGWTKQPDRPGQEHVMFFSSFRT